MMEEIPEMVGGGSAVGSPTVAHGALMMDKKRKKIIVTIEIVSDDNIKWRAHSLTVNQVSE